jgi:uncharacterized tellurite resistance protein B-like protein
MVKHMKDESQARLLMKILIGVAWLDGAIQPEERQYLAKIAQAHHLDGDPEIEALLSGTPKIHPIDCENWIKEYLGDRSIQEDDKLIEAISGLIYSDGDVAMAEAKLLANIQSQSAATTTSSQSLTTKVRQLYQNWLRKV